MPKSQPYDPWEPLFDPTKLIAASRLTEFLLDPTNSVARERIFTFRLISDLKLAAATAGYHLQSYEPSVDRDGHDVVLEDNIRSMWLQLKTVYQAETIRWHIRKRLIAPDARYAATFGMLPPGKDPYIELLDSEGLQGGVVLIDPETIDGRMGSVCYWYSDVFVITAIQNGLAPGYTVSSAVSNRVTRDLENGQTAGEFVLPKSFFVKTKDAEKLLALAGLTSRYSSSWRLNVVRYFQTDRQQRLAEGEKEEWQQTYSDQVSENLLQLIEKPE